MTSEPYPEIVFDISLPTYEVLALIKQASIDSSFLRIVSEGSDASWSITRIDDREKKEAKCKLAIALEDKFCRLYFSASTAYDSYRLADTVAICLGLIFKGSKVVGPDLRPLPNIPCASDAIAERIATLLGSREAMTITEITKSLAMLEYTVAVNLQRLLEKGIIGCTPSHVTPRRYFYK